MKKGWLWVLVFLLLAYGGLISYFWLKDIHARDVAIDKLQCRLKDGSYWCDFGLNTVVPQVKKFSMYPTFFDSDFLMCTPFVAQDNLLAGGIYTYKTSTDMNFSIAHRCVSPVDSGAACVFKGDGNLWIDGVIQKGDVLAKCNWLVRFVG